MQHKEKLCFLCVVLTLTFILLSGCTESAKSEEDIVDDLQHNSTFSSNMDIPITEYNIIKRQTDVEEKSDVVYINVEAENDRIWLDRSYIMTYGLYNEGWILDNVTSYNEVDWKIRPLQGVEEEVLQQYIDSFQNRNESDAIKIIDRATELEENWGEDEIIFQTTKEHLYGTEILEYSQKWSFDTCSCEFITAGEPQRIDRSIILNENIVGAKWENLARYKGTQNIFADQFDIQVVSFGEDGLSLWVTKKDIWTARWEGLSEPIISSMPMGCAMLMYLSESDEIGFSLAPLSGLLYDSSSDDNFDNDDYFVFDLDSPGVGKIVKIYSAQSKGIIAKGITSGKSVEEEATEYAISVAKEHGMISYDPDNPICGVWDWDSDDSEFGNTIWCIWPDGTFDAYINADDGHPLGKEYIGEIGFSGEWSYDGDILSLKSFYSEGYESAPLAWNGHDTFELIEDYSAYYRANRMNYNIEGDSIQFHAPVREEVNNDELVAVPPTLAEKMEQMLPEASGLIELDVSLPSIYENGDTNYVTEVYKAANNVGYVFVIVGDGFGGKGTMKIMTSINAEGKIVQTQTIEHQETSGLGARTAKDDFRNQFIGVDSNTLDSSIDAVTGATLSTNCYLDSIRSAFDAFDFIEKNQ